MEPKCSACDPAQRGRRHQRMNITTPWIATLSTRRTRASAGWVLWVLCTGCGQDGEAQTQGSDAVMNATATSHDTDPTGASQSEFSEQEVEIILSWLGPLPPVPPADLSNAFADDLDAARLGQALFYEPRYSSDGTISCATCHDSAAGFGDSRANTSLGVSMTGRASISLYNGAYGAAAEGDTNWQLWDGRADTQWSQALGPPESGVVMGGTRSAVALLIYDEYREDYETVFGPMPMLRDDLGEAVAQPDLKPGMKEWDALPEGTRTDITGVYVNFGKSIAAYERMLVSRNSRFDRFWQDLSQGALDSDALTEPERLGLRVFIGKGRCLGCHSGPNFTDNQFHNIGVAQGGDNIPDSDEGRAAGVGKLLGSAFNCASSWSDHPNKGECAVTTLGAMGGELGAFKTPSLRSINLSPPYMHTGNLATLESVIQHYDLGGAPNGTFDGVRDELIRPLSLDATERRSLAAFVTALEGEALDPSLLGPL